MGKFIVELLSRYSKGPHGTCDRSVYQPRSSKYFALMCAEGRIDPSDVFIFREVLRAVGSQAETGTHEGKMDSVRSVLPL